MQTTVRSDGKLWLVPSPTQIYNVGSKDKSKRMSLQYPVAATLLSAKLDLGLKGKVRPAGSTAATDGNAASSLDAIDYQL